MQTKEERKEYQKKWRENNKEEIIIKDKKWREKNPKYNKEYYQNNKEEILEYAKEYRENNKEEILEQAKEYRKNHREEAKKWRENHKEEASEYAKEYNKNNKEEIKKQKKEYYFHNKEEILEKAKEYNKNHKEERNNYINLKLQNDVNFKLSRYLRSRLNSAIKNNQKSGSAVRDLGCSISELILYLESKFQPGMTWDNWSYKGWHIDHIIPLSSFNLEVREELLKAVYFTNLQPLWAKDNLSKGNKI